MSNKGFTLIEMLVVVAIVSLLAGMLFPVFSAARETARKANCLSNVRQLAMAMLMYADDHDGVFVPAWDAANLTRWHGARSSTTDAFDPTRGPIWGYSRSREIKVCKSFYPATGAGAFELGTGGYGYNAQYVGGSPRPWPASLEPASMADVERADETIMLAETAFLDWDMMSGSGAAQLIEYSFVEAPFYEAYGNSPADPSTHFRHNGKAAVAFCDGHVKAMAGVMWRGSGWTYSDDVFKRMNLGFCGMDNSLYDRE